MARNDNHRKKVAATEVTDTAGDAPPESLDKVRDILFGGQMRTVEARLRSLDQRVREDQAALRAEFARQLAELGAATEKGIKSLGERLEAERSKRTEDLKGLAAEIREALKSLEKRHSKLEETSGTADADLRDQILLNAKAASTELARLSDRLSAELTRSHQQLKADKADLASLASVFADMSARLGAEAKGGKSAAKG